jgi:hypothetical protein
VFQAQDAHHKPGGRLTLFVQLATLFLTGSALWFFRIAPRLLRKSPRAVLVEALVFAAIAWAWSAVISFGLYLTIPAAERGDAVRATLRTSAVAVWFAPATILLSEFSPGALVAALVLVIGATRLLYSEWRRGTPPAEDAPIPALVPFEALALPRTPLLRELAPAFAVSSSLQGGSVAVALHFPLLAAACFALGTSMLTVSSMASGAYVPGRPPSLPRSIVGVFATILLAVTLTVGGSPGFLFPSAGWSWHDASGGKSSPGIFESARALLRRLLYGEGPLGPRPAADSGQAAAVAQAKPNSPEFPETPGEDLPGSYPGVVLRPEVNPVATLVAPLRAAGQSIFAARNAQPYSIPFGGEYWMYRFPYKRPPRRSYLRRGSPARLSFKTTDRGLLRMEARQKLVQAVAANCCAKLRLEIRNADLYPNTVSLEVMLIDNDSPGPPSGDLGIARVQSVPDLRADPVVPVAESLEYAFPRPGPLEAFDEIRVVFLRDYLRGDKSARIEIERFVLVP